jgi:hypothetical protein
MARRYMNSIGAMTRWRHLDNVSLDSIRPALLYCVPGVVTCSTEELASIGFFGKRGS